MRSKSCRTHTSCVTIICNTSDFDHDALHFLGSIAIGRKSGGVAEYPPSPWSSFRTPLTLKYFQCLYAIHTKGRPRTLGHQTNRRCDSRQDGCKPDGHSAQSAAQTDTSSGHAHGCEDNGGYPERDFNTVKDQKGFETAKAMKSRDISRQDLIRDNDEGFCRLTSVLLIPYTTIMLTTLSAHRPVVSDLILAKNIL